MNKAEYEKELKKIQHRNNEILARRKLNQMKLKRFPKLKKPSNSKMALWAVILLNFQIVYFVESAIMKYGDLSALYALIAIPATLFPTMWAYYSKSKTENSVGGIVYETTMEELRNKSETMSDDSVG